MHYIQKYCTILLKLTAVKDSNIRFLLVLLSALAGIAALDCFPP
jgi:hypothetical protein